MDSGHDTSIIQRGANGIGQHLSKKLKNGQLDIYSLKNEFFEILPQLLGGALMIVTALSWNDAMRSVIDYYVPENISKSENVWWKVAYAFILTIFMVTLTLVLYYVSIRTSEAIDYVIPEEVLAKLKASSEEEQKKDQPFEGISEKEKIVSFMKI